MSELEEDRKFYKVELSNKNEYQVSGITKKSIMASTSQFVELESGEVINKSFIVSISLDREETRRQLLLPLDTTIIPL